MSIPISQFIPPRLSPFVTISFLHLGLYFINKFICTIFLDSAYKQYHMIFVLLCLTLLSMTISRTIRVTANGIISFIFMAESLCIKELL